MRKRFDFDMNENEGDVIKRVKEEHDFATDTKALRFIISEYGRLSEAPMETADALSHLEEQLSGIQRSIRVLDENVAVIMDVENTLITIQHVEHNVPVDIFEAIPVREARENYHEKAAHNRQKWLSEKGRSHRSAKYY